MPSLSGFEPEAKRVGYGSSNEYNPLQFESLRAIEIVLYWLHWNFAICNQKLINDNQTFPSNFCFKQLDW